MATLAIASNLDTIADDETLVTYDGALGNIKVQLPTVVSGGTGDAVDLGWATEIQNNGDATLEILENGATGFRRVAFMEPYSVLVLRSTAMVDRPPWLPSDHLKEIIATSEELHVVDLSVTDIAVAGVTNNVSNTDTYDAAGVKTSFDTQLDVAADELESEAGTAFGEVETTVAAVIDLLEACNISAAS